MGAQGVLRHELLGNLPRQRRVDTALDVDVGELLLLERSVLAQLLALACEVGLLGVGLRTDGDILAGGHRHGAGHQPGDARDQHRVLGRGRRGHADDQARGRDDPVVGPEHGSTQPPDTADQMVLGLLAKAAHVTLSGRIRSVP